MMKIKQIVCLSTLLFAGSANALLVNFSGTMDGFNTGPFSGGTEFSGSFNMDESVIATGGNNNFNGALDNLVITIGGYSFTGDNGLVQQYSSGSGATDFFLSNTTSVTGNVGADIFTKFSVDWRGTNLFDDPTVLANNLETANFNYRRIVFQFNNSSGQSVIDNAAYISFGPSAVPVPAAAWLFGSGLLGLIGVTRRNQL